MSFKDYSQQMYKWLHGEISPVVSVDGNVSVVVDEDKIYSARLVLMRGTATGGSETTIVDDTKDFDVAAFDNKMAKVVIGDVEYYRAISAAAGATLTIATIRDAVGATVTIGSGKDSEGQATILCKGDIGGAVGNDYSFKVVQGTEQTNDETIALNTETKTLTVTVNLTSEGAVRTIGMGSLQTLIANAVDIKDKFQLLDGFTAGDLPVGEESAAFVGGLDSVPVTAGCVYEVLIKLPNGAVHLSGNKPEISSAQDIQVATTVKTYARADGASQIEVYCESGYVRVRTDGDPCTATTGEPLGEGFCAGWQVASISIYYTSDSTVTVVSR